MLPMPHGRGVGQDGAPAPNPAEEGPVDAVNMVLSVPVIVALVELAKRLGISGRLAMLAAIVLGVALSLATYYLGAYGGYQAAAQGVLLGLSAAGLYDTAKVASVKISAAPTVSVSTKKTSKPAG